MRQYGKREYGNLIFNQLTVELTTASSYLGQGAGLSFWGRGGDHPHAHDISLGGDIKIPLLAFHFYDLPGVIPAIGVF